MVATEDLVGTLPALDDANVLCDFAREQEETDVVVADHRFGHGFDGRRQRCNHFVRRHLDLVMLGSIMTGNEIGIMKLVALFATH